MQYQALCHREHCTSAVSSTMTPIRPRKYVQVVHSSGLLSVAAAPVFQSIHDVLRSSDRPMQSRSPIHSADAARRIAGHRAMEGSDWHIVHILFHLGAENWARALGMYLSESDTVVITGGEARSPLPGTCYFERPSTKRQRTLVLWLATAPGALESSSLHTRWCPVSASCIDSYERGFVNGTLP